VTDIFRPIVAPKGAWKSAPIYNLLKGTNDTGATTPVLPKEISMPKKPNYRFERSERDRQKALKKAARLTTKQERTKDLNEDSIVQDQETEQAS
jgi:hypothetical protein